MAYTYLIGWKTYNVWYYGRRTKSGCHPTELWKNYYTSSKHVKQFRTKYGEPDIIQIRKIFDNVEKCCYWENKVLQRINARDNPKFLNKTNGDKRWDRTGVKDSDETRLKKSLSRIGNKNPNYGKITNLETRLKISNTLKGRSSPLKGKKRGPESPETTRKRVEKNSKKYIVISPSGSKFEIKNLSEFCRNNNLLNACMVEVAKGNRIQHKGWRCLKLQ